MQESSQKAAEWKGSTCTGPPTRWGCLGLPPQPAPPPAPTRKLSFQSNWGRKGVCSTNAIVEAFHRAGLAALPTPPRSLLAVWGHLSRWSPTSGGFSEPTEPVGEVGSEQPQPSPPPHLSPLAPGASHLFPGGDGVEEGAPPGAWGEVGGSGGGERSLPVGAQDVQEQDGPTQGVAGQAGGPKGLAQLSGLVFPSCDLCAERAAETQGALAGGGQVTWGGHAGVGYGEGSRPTSAVGDDLCKQHKVLLEAAEQ